MGSAMLPRGFDSVSMPPLHHVLTLSRGLLGAGTVFVFSRYGLDWLAFGAFVFFVLTDWLDGFIARRRGETSTLGGFLDPLADKMFLVPLLWVMLASVVPTAQLVLYIAIECLLLFFSVFFTVYKHGLFRDVVPANPCGKIKTGIGYVCIALALGGYMAGRGAPNEIFVALVFLMSMAALGSFLWRFFFGMSIAFAGVSSK